MPGHDSEKLLGLLLGLQVEVVLANDALGVAGLQSGLAHRAEFADVHRNERMAHDVM